LIYEVVYCSDCKKPIKSVPSWLADVNVRFTCETCRQKHPRGVLGYDSGVVPHSGIDPDLEGVAALNAPVDEASSDDVALDDVDPDAAIEGDSEAIVPAIGEE
jgi:hypothetical protein